MTEFSGDPTSNQRTKKKGNISWNPAQKLAVKNKDPNFVYRWCWNDPQNIETKLDEGWIKVDKVKGIRAEHDHPHEIGDGIPLDSTKTYRELVLMALPLERKEARDRWVQERTDQQTRGIKRELDSNLRGHPQAPADASTYGRVIIE